MKSKKRLIGFLLIAVLISTVLGVSIFASERSFAERTRDDIHASLEILTSEDGFTAHVTANNLACEYVDSIRLTLHVPDSFGIVPDVIPDGESDSYTAGTVFEYELLLPKGEQYENDIKSLDISKISTETEPPKAETPGDDTDAESGKTDENESDEVESPATADSFLKVLICALSIFAVIFVSSLIISKKFGRSFLSLMLVAVMVVPMLAFSYLPISAAETERGFSLAVGFEYEGARYTCTLDVEYDYKFEEAAVEGTTGMDRFDITYYWGPHGNEVQDENFFKAIAECGFTTIPLEMNSAENNKIALEYMKEYGLTCSALFDWNIYDIITQHTPETITQQEVDGWVEFVVEKYAEFDNIEGWWLYDEPDVYKFPILGMVVDAFKRIDPDRECVINLFPNYATAQQLGADTYDDYLQTFIDIVDPHYISYDHYHFTTSGPRAGFYTNLESVRRAGLEAGLDQMQIILLTQHLNYEDLTYEQLAFEVNMSLVYGMKRMSYFTFILDDSMPGRGWSNACMGYDGTIYPHYYDVQNISKWLMPLGTELFDKTSTAVFHSPNGQRLEAYCTKYTTYGDLGEVEGSNFVYGFFDDCSFMIVNKEYDAEDGENVLTLIDVKEGLEYFDAINGAWKSVDGDPRVSRDGNGRYTISFDAGEGILFRVN